jgi:integrase
LLSILYKLDITLPVPVDAVKPLQEEMSKMKQHGNRPAKGSIIKVEPIRDLKDVKMIKKLLADKPRDLCLFVVGINTNLRASDLLKLTAGQVKGLKPNDEIDIRETKTSKQRKVCFNKSCIESIAGLLNSRVYADDECLFVGQRGCLTVPSVVRLVKGWCSDINLKGNYGSHTLRKTFGYHQHHTFGVSLPLLMEAFNHSNQKVTLNYLCISDAMVRNIFLNEL